MGTLQQQSILKGLHVERNKNYQLVHKTFYNVAEKYANQPAILYDDERGRQHCLTYEELNKRTNQLARALGNYKAENKQAFVAVCMKPTHNLPTVLLAVLKAGMAYLPLDVEFPMSRVKHVLQEAQPLMVIVEDDTDTTIYEGTFTITYKQLFDEAQRESSDALDINEIPEQLAIVLYTSGSTGIPKGVLLPHATLLNRLQWQWRELPYSPNEDRCVFKTSLTFVDSVPEIWGPLLQGRTLVVVPKHITKDPEQFVQLLEKHEIQRLVLVPSLLRSLLMYLGLREKRSALSSLRLWICSGETLPVSLAEEFFDTFDDGNRVLANFYGSTEIMGDVTFHLLSDRCQLQGIEKVPIGKPMDNSIIYLVNKELQLVPQEEIGELVVAGRNLAAGYIRDRDTNKFLDNPHAIDPDYSRIFRTGDYGRIVKGSVIFEGRVDSQIKVRGHRVDLAEVEKAVYKAPAVDKAVVLCYKPGELSQALLAFVTAKEGTSISASQIENFLQNILPPYMKPSVIVIDRMPLLTNGKTDRQLLLKQYEASTVNLENDVALQCDYNSVSQEDLPKAKVLFPTIASAIGKSGRAAVSVNANFYELGGNSLNSIYTVTILRDQGYEIGITEFITARNLAEVLSLMKPSTDETSTLQEGIDEKKYSFEMLNHSHKEHAIRIITESFYTKADLEQWLIPDIKREDYTILLELLWNSLVEKGLSFVVKSAQNDKILGVCLNFDVWDEPEVTLESKLMIVFDFLEYLEAPIRERKLPKGKGQIVHNFMMSTNSDQNAAQNVILMKVMEEYCLRLCKEKNYVGIFTTNTSPLTQQLGIDVFGYESLMTYQVNKYVTADGSKPFGMAPDSQLAICALKMVD